MDIFETVLLIEDNHDLRVFERQILEEKGFRVFSATNGKDALELINDGLYPGVIVLDLAMPIMDGEEFLNHIQKENLCPDAEVIIVSGTGPISIDRSMYSSYLPKPFLTEEFMHKIPSIGKDRYGSFL